MATAPSSSLPGPAVVTSTYASVTSSTAAAAAAARWPDRPFVSRVPAISRHAASAASSATQAAASVGGRVPAR